MNPNILKPLADALMVHLDLSDPKQCEELVSMAATHITTSRKKLMWVGEVLDGRLKGE